MPVFMIMKERIMQIIALLLLATGAQAQTPLDSTFGTNGISTLNMITANHCKATAMQSDGKILCYYLSTINCFSDYIFRLMPNGSLDTTFTPSPSNETNPKIDGLFYQSVSGSSDHSILRQTSQGSIIWGSSGYCIRRLLPSGLNDASFGCVNINAILNKPYDLYHLTDFHEDVAGGAYYIASYSWLKDTVYTAKILNTGVIDNSYGFNGALAIPLPPATIYGSNTGAIHFSNTGDVLVYGSSSASPIHQAALFKYDLNGNLDATFGTNGVYVHSTAGTARFTHITEDLNGDIYAYGVSGNDVFVVKLNASGVLDASFGTAGQRNYAVQASGNSSMFSTPKVFNGAPCNTINTNIAVNVTAQSYNSFLPGGNNNLLFGSNGQWGTSTNYRIGKMVCQQDSRSLAMGSDSLHPRVLRYNTQEVPSALHDLNNERNVLTYFNKTVNIKSSTSIVRPKMSLFAMDGTIIYTFENQQVPSNASEISVSLPNDLPLGIYIFTIETKGQRNQLKLFNY